MSCHIEITLILWFTFCFFWTAKCGVQGYETCNEPNLNTLFYTSSNYLSSLCTGRLLNPKIPPFSFCHQMIPRNQFCQLWQKRHMSVLKLIIFVFITVTNILCRHAFYGDSETIRSLLLNFFYLFNYRRLII